MKEKRLLEINYPTGGFGTIRYRCLALSDIEYDVLVDRLALVGVSVRHIYTVRGGQALFSVDRPLTASAGPYTTPPFEKVASCGCSLCSGQSQFAFTM